MRKLIVSTFASLDGIMQAPADRRRPTGVLRLAVGCQLLGRRHGHLSSRFRRQGSRAGARRRTYEIFEAYWPYQPDDHRLRRRSMQRKVCCFAHVDGAPLEQLDPAPRRCRLGNHRSQGPTGPRPADDWQRQFDSNAPGRLTDRRVQRVDFPVVLGRASASSARPPSHRRCGSFALRFRPPAL